MNVLSNSLRDIAVDHAVDPSRMPWTGWKPGPQALYQARGVDVDNLDFEGSSYGRTSMEYYDGFVFGFYAETRPDLPPGGHVAGAMMR